MNTFSSFFRGIFLMAFVASFASCQKLIDRLWPGHGNGKGDSTTTYRIKTLKYWHEVATDTSALGIAHFYYSGVNRLDSIVCERSAESFYDKILRFAYDSSGNLTQFSGTQLDPALSYIFVYNTYTYSGSSILTDTLRQGFYMSDFNVFSNPVYDAQKRIKGDIYNYNSNGIQFDVNHEAVFNYDSSGNRGRVEKPLDGTVANTGGGVTDSTVYDNKKSYRSTNFVFQIIDRDFSKNNSSYAFGYNVAGLPTGFRKGSTEEFLNLGEPREIEWEEVLE